MQPAGGWHLPQSDAGQQQLCATGGAGTVVMGTSICHADIVHLMRAASRRRAFDVEVEQSKKAMKYDRNQMSARTRNEALRFLSFVCRAFFLLSLVADVSAQVVFRAATSASLAAGNAGITYVGSGGAATGNSGNLTPALPGGLQANDLLVCLVESTDTVDHSINDAAWTRLAYPAASGSHRASLFWRLAISNTPTPTIVHPAGSRIVARCSGFRGVDPAAPFDVPFAAVNSAADLTVESGVLNTTTNGAWVLFAAHVASRPSGLTMTTTGGLSWSSAYFSRNNSAPGAAIGLFYSGRAGAASGRPGGRHDEQQSAWPEYRCADRTAPVDQWQCAGDRQTVRNRSQ